MQTKKNIEKDTKPRAWWFNPQNDLALAASTPYYTAPKGAMALARAGELLPIFLSDPKDCIITGGVNARWLADLSSKLNLNINLWNRDTRSFRPTPWGWSAAAVSHFIQLGFDASDCPDAEKINYWRELSGRRTVELLDKLIFPDSYRSRVVSQPDAIIEVLGSYGSVALKIPWSCSGRGVFFYDNAHREAAVKKASEIISTYGYATVEPRLERPTEFGLLFDHTPGSTDFRGISRTLTSHNGKYLGSIVAPSDEHINAIDTAIGTPGFCGSLIERTTKAVETVLGNKYYGPIGLDFLISQGDAYLAEHNLRFTMGFVADGVHKLTGSQGILTVHQSNIPAAQDAIVLTQPGCDMRFEFRADQ